MSAHDEAAEIQATMHSPGWRYIEAMLDEQAREPQDELFQIMSKRPDTLTGKSAMRLAAKCAALKDFKESVYGRLSILLPNRKVGAQTETPHGSLTA